MIRRALLALAAITVIAVMAAVVGVGYTASALNPVPATACARCD